MLALGLLVAALVAGTLGALTMAYVVLSVLVVGVGWGFAGSGIWLWLLAFAILKVEWRDKRFASACLRFALWFLAGMVWAVPLAITLVGTIVLAAVFQGNVPKEEKKPAAKAQSRATLDSTVPRVS